MSEAALLQAIMDSPDDDVPRLVYADFLEERDEGDRAEFIRVQCERTRLPEKDQRQASLEARERELLVAHGERWVRAFGAGISRWVFRRGFLEEMTIPVASYLENRSTLSQLAPILRFQLDLTGVEVPASVMELLPESMARDHAILLLAEHQNEWLVAMADPGNTHVSEMIRFVFNKEVVGLQAPTDHIHEAIERLYGERDPYGCHCIDDLAGFELPTESAEFTEWHNTPIFRTITIFIGLALQYDASEVIWEAQTDTIRVWYRSGESLIEQVSFPRPLFQHLVKGIQHLVTWDDAAQSGVGALNIRGRRVGISVSLTGEGQRLQIALHP
jgi:uncharacterized protein (TIGR02996 family)